MMPARATLPVLLALTTIVACADGTGPKADVVDSGDPDAIGPDTDTDTVVDSDDSDTTVVSDTDPLDDTFIGGDTDTGIDDTPVVLVRTTIPNVHAAIHTPGQTLLIDGSVVTAVRYTLNPPATNGFVVQDPTVGVDGGLYIHVIDSADLPAVGDVVNLAGIYEEWPATAPPLTGTMARLNIHPSLPDTSWLLTGTAAVPAPIPVDIATLQAYATAERYESMLVHLEEPTGLDVVSLPIASNGEFRVSTVGTVDQVIIDPQFFDLRSVLTINRGDGLSGITGVLYHEVNGYKVAPRSLADVDAWVDQ